VLDSAAAYATYQTHPAVLEGLLRFASDGESVEAGLADEWDYDAGARTWTFRIRDSARFSDGEPVTSADVAFSLEVWEQGPNFGPLYAGVTRVRTLDERTVVFEMKTPNSVFDALLSASVSGVMPEDFGGVSENQFYRDPVGAGPYKVEEWSRGGEIVLSPNELAQPVCAESEPKLRGPGTAELAACHFAWMNEGREQSATPAVVTNEEVP
jgi:peptide/nickel transport system substrate-binding protein